MKKHNKRILLIIIISLITICTSLLLYFLFFKESKNVINNNTTTLVIKDDLTTTNSNETTLIKNTKKDKTTKIKKNKSTKTKTTISTTIKNKTNKNNTVEVNTTTKNTTKKVVTTLKSTTKIVKNTTKKKETTKKTNSNQIVRDNVLDVKEGSEVVKQEEKYGVKITITEDYAFLTYVDGSIERIVKKTNKDINRDGYNGSTSAFKSEASGLISKNTSYANTILDLTNKYRNEAGVTNNLTLDNTLSLAANIRALEIAYSDVFSHNRPNGTYFNTVLDEIGYSYMGLGENIAYGQKTASVVSESWKNSSGHYKNMVNDKFNKLGVGHVNFEGVNYWVQIFSN